MEIFGSFLISCSMVIVTSFDVLCFMILAGYIRRQRNLDLLRLLDPNNRFKRMPCVYF